MKSLSMCSLALVATMMIGTSRAQVVISEFLAKNDSTLADGDGNYSDWIELYNTGDSAVDLTGWFLTDDTADLQQWAFPSTSIAAGEYLIVFASGQAEVDHSDSLGYLHTTFKLSGDGESIVLTQPDGVTIEHSFVDFPAQSDDISYGIPRDSTYTTLIAADESVRALIPSSSAAATDWHSVGYDDTGWLTGQQGVGYETGSGYASSIGLNVLPMRNQTGSVYVRIPFDVSEAGSMASLSLRTKYDDGFVAFLNGVEIARANAPASLAGNSLATSSHEADVDNFVDFDVSGFVGALQEGANMLAIQGLNTPTNSSDMLFVAELNAAVAGELQTDTVSYLPTPTPGAANLSGFLGYVADTKFSIDRGFYTDAFEVEISCDSAGAEIYYTIDGTTPTPNNGSLYSGAITIDRTTVLRAAAFVTGYQPSNVDTQTYLFMDDIVSQSSDAGSQAPEWPSGSVNGQVFDYAMDPDIVNAPDYANLIDDALLDIPSISIVTDPDNLFDPSIGIYVNPQSDGRTWERETSVELIHPDGTDGFQINGGIRIRGGSSRATSNPKHSFRLFFRSEYGTARLNYDLFGDEGADSFKRIDLRTGQNYSWNHGSRGSESTWLYDIFTRDAHREMGQPYTRGRFYHLYLNGLYWGLYQTEERPDARYGESYHGGDSDDYDVVKSGDNRGLIEATDGVLDDYQDLWTAVNSGISSDSAYFAIQGMNADGTRNASYRRLLDVDNLIDYMLCVYYSGNRDSPLGPPGGGREPRNLFAFFNRTSPDGFKFVAHDGEHCLGYHLSDGVNYNHITAYSPLTSSTLRSQAYFNPWWLHLKLVDNDEYRLRLADRVHRHFFNGGILTPERVAGLVTTRKTEMELAIIAESARWGDFVTSTPRTKNDDWLPAVNSILDSYVQASPNTRTDVVFGQIEAQGWYPSVDAPEFNQHGGSVVGGFALSISGSSQIYYTLDGTDPREVGTGSAVGSLYAGAIPLTRSTLVKARVLSGTTWSALTAATFEINDESPLRVTEIMYHPAEGTSGDELNYSNEEFEFIELLNTGTEAIGLAGTQFTNGIYFDFSEGNILTLDPGEYVLLVNNLEAFALRYPDAASMNIAGEYYGKFFLADADLANNGEGITLLDGLGRTILDFVYDDTYPLTEGDGYSLTLIDPTAAKSTWNTSEAWRASTAVGGTPGEAAVDPDADSDGMPDSWETYYFGSTNETDEDDWDGDGTSNYTEFRAGTDPTDPDSALRITGLAPTMTSVEVNWSSEADKTYTLQSSSELTEESWTDVASGLGADPPTNSYTHYSSNSAAFYRVMVE